MSHFYHSNILTHICSWRWMTGHAKCPFSFIGAGCYKRHLFMAERVRGRTPACQVKVGQGCNGRINRLARFKLRLFIYFKGRFWVFAASLRELEPISLKCEECPVLFLFLQHTVPVSRVFALLSLTGLHDEWATSLQVVMCCKQEILARAQAQRERRNRAVK